jgi:hypothetical protein
MPAERHNAPNQSAKLVAFKSFIAQNLARQKAASELMSALFPQADASQRDAFAADWLSSEKEAAIEQEFAEWQEARNLPD